jgi:hypothetical protein
MMPVKVWELVGYVPKFTLLSCSARHQILLTLLHWLKGCLFELFVAFHKKKLPKRTKQLASALCFDEATERYRQTRESRSGGASRGFMYRDRNVFRMRTYRSALTTPQVQLKFSSYMKSELLQTCIIGWPLLLPLKRKFVIQYSQYTSITSEISLNYSQMLLILGLFIRVVLLSYAYMLTTELLL